MKYPHSTSAKCPEVREMPPVTATTLKNSTSDVLDQVASRGPVAITKHNKPRAVLLPVELYEEISTGKPGWLSDLYAEGCQMLEEMQSPEQKEGALQAFQASPEELGNAAVRASQCKKD